MRFRGDPKNVDDDGRTWQDDEIKRLESKCAELIVENEVLKEQLELKNYDQTYRENKLLKLELNNMYILEEENKDLKDELERLKGLTYEDKVKDTIAENSVLRERNGFLQVRV